MNQQAVPKGHIFIQAPQSVESLSDFQQFQPSTLDLELFPFCFCFGFFFFPQAEKHINYNADSIQCFW